jgi:ribosomal protein S18 acetylase RimI-like enzyme
MLTIRKAKRSDVSALSTLRQELADYHIAFARGHRELAPHLHEGSGAVRHFAGLARKVIKSKTGIVFLAEVNGKPVGYSLAYIKSNLLKPKASRLGYIDDLYVRKEFRGQHIGSAITRRTIAWFRGRGIRHLTLNVLEQNRAAQAIYRKWGFFPLSVKMRKNL